MTDKQQYALNTILSALPDDCKQSYSDIAEYAISLGYMPVLKGAHSDYAVFTSPRLKKTILKINTNPRFRCISMKFFAIYEYTGIFERALQERLATWKRLGYAYRCFGCGKCDGTQGYKVALEDGTQGFLCGFCVLPLPSFSAEHTEEVKRAMSVQDDFFVKNASKSNKKQP